MKTVWQSYSDQDFWTVKSHDRNLLANNKAMLRRFPFQHYRNQVFMGQQMIDKEMLMLLKIRENMKPV